MINLDEIKARAEAATPGPWCRDFKFIDDIIYWACGPDVNTMDQCNSDMDFIAHAREDIPALVAEVERLRAALEKVWRDPGFEYRDIARRALDGEK